MIQCANGVGFLLQTFPELRGANADRNVTTQVWIMCLPHFSHATFANGPKDFTRVELGTGRERHTGIQFSLAEWGNREGMNCVMTFS
jgi:hypothetical protein